MTSTLSACTRSQAAITSGIIHKRHDAEFVPNWILLHVFCLHKLIDVCAVSNVTSQIREPICSGRMCVLALLYALLAQAPLMGWMLSKKGNFSLGPGCAYTLLGLLGLPPHTASLFSGCLRQTSVCKLYSGSGWAVTICLGTWVAEVQCPGHKDCATSAMLANLAMSVISCLNVKA